MKEGKRKEKKEREEEEEERNTSATYWINKMHLRYGLFKLWCRSYLFQLNIHMSEWLSHVKTHLIQLFPEQGVENCSKVIKTKFFTLLSPSYKNI